MMIGDKPDYKISIYDIEEKKMLTIDEKLKDKQYLTAAFNPADPDQFFVASPNNLTFYSIIKNSYLFSKEDAGKNKGAGNQGNPYSTNKDNGEGTINK